MIYKTRIFISIIFISYENVGHYLIHYNTTSIHYNVTLSFASYYLELKKLAHTSNTLEVYNYRSKTYSSSKLSIESRFWFSHNSQKSRITSSQARSLKPRGLVFHKLLQELRSIYLHKPSQKPRSNIPPHHEEKHASFWPTIRPRYSTQTTNTWKLTYRLNTWIITT